MNFSNNVRVRFAPSPTGELHLGGARTALSNFLFAKNKGGKFLLRIEDTDLERSKKSYTDQIINSIKWLGLKWDEEITFQSNRIGSYSKYLNILLKSGAAYRCFATKDELEKNREETSSYQYNGLWRNRTEEEISEQLTKGIPYTIRLKTPKKGHVNLSDLIYGDIKVANSEIDDFIIMRSDGSPVYNFTNVIDDYDMNISHVIRGEDHISNTHKQIHIYLALNWEIPQFAHLPMILGQDKKRLSKRHGASSVESYRMKGYQPEVILNYLALLGWNPGTEEEIMDLSKLISKFDLSRVQKKSAIFDQKKFDWISSEHLTKQNKDEILKFIKKIDSNWGRGKENNFCIKVITMMIPRSNSLTDIIENSHYFFQCPKEFDKNSTKKIWKDNTREIIKELISLYQVSDNWDNLNLETIFKDYIGKHGYTFGQIMKPMRLAICGSLTGPSLFELMELLGSKEIIYRLNHAVNVIKINE